MNSARGLVVLFAVVNCVSAACVAEEPGTARPISLFDGTTLQGWRAHGCEAIVNQGAILLQAGDGFLRGDYRYRNFVLDLEWKASKDQSWDSCVFFHAELPPQGKPRRHRISLRQGQEGDLDGIENAKGGGLARPGEWNHFRLTVNDGTAALEINGQAAWKIDSLPTEEGYLGFQSETLVGGQLALRNIRVTELDMEPLFNGANLAGWEGATAPAETCWKVEAGAIVCTGEKGTWLRSSQQYGDYCLRLDYKVSPAGNSGVYVRVPADGDHHGADAGVEIQVLDDKHPKYADLKPFQYTGSVYAVAPAESHVGLPAGEWNRLEINVQGDQYRITHNGVTIVNADAKSHPELAVRLKRGYLGLQNHSTEVAFRNLRLGPPLP